MAQTATPAVSGKSQAEPLTQVDDLLARGEVAAALKRVEDFLQRNPCDIEARWRHGQCLERAGRHEEALQVYERLLANHPAHPAAQQRRDLLLSVLRRPKRVTVPSLDRSWNTGLPKEAMMQIQLATHAYAYRGVPLIKNPFDLALYQLVLWNLKPRTIIEIGSKSGGSAMWLADLQKIYGLEGQVYSLDIVPVTGFCHPGVAFLEGDGRRLETSLSATFLQAIPRPLLVIEDADHTYETSSATLRFFAPWLQSGEYIIIEDGILSDMLPAASGLCGPHRAIQEFLKTHQGEYEIAAELCDFFGYNYTWCTNGYLRRVRSQ